MNPKYDYQANERLISRLLWVFAGLFAIRVVLGLIQIVLILNGTP